MSTSNTKNALVLEEDLLCEICHETLYKPITLHCQHTFCTSCISGIKMNNEDVQNWKCPSCRARFLDPLTGYTNKLIEKLTEKFHDTKALEQRSKESIKINNEKEIQDWNKKCDNLSNGQNRLSINLTPLFENLDSDTESETDTEPAEDETDVKEEVKDEKVEKKNENEKEISIPPASRNVFNFHFNIETHKKSETQSDNYAPVHSTMPVTVREFDQLNTIRPMSESNRLVVLVSLVMCLFYFLTKF